MIKRRKKICKACQTEQYLFGQGMCESCYRKSRAYAEITDSARKAMESVPNRTVEPPKSVYKALSHKSNSKIPLRTKKRLQQEKEYAVICGIIDRRAKERGEWRCFFCGNKFRKESVVDHHHLYGREGDALVREADIVICHRHCHKDYHDKSVHKIKWYKEWLERIKKTHYALYEKELIKIDK